VRREAQRCLANALFLKPDDRGAFVDVGGVDKFVDAFKASVQKPDADDDFLLGRIGFLLTATKGPVVERLVNEDGVYNDMNEVSQMLHCKAETLDSIVLCHILPGGLQVDGDALSGTYGALKIPL
jgi:hypothetical protein